jgi:hypothetical protein
LYKCDELDDPYWERKWERIRRGRYCAYRVEGSSGLGS